MADLTLGLRFKRRDAQRLRDIAYQLQGRPDIDISLYDRAADSAERDEPLEVACSNRDEVELMASAFVTLGFDRPAIDELNG